MVAGSNLQQPLRRKGLPVAECAKTYKAMATTTLKTGPGGTPADPDGANE